MKTLSSFFSLAVERGASDLHLICGELPMLRVAGELTALSDAPLPEKETEEDLLGLLSADQKKRFQEELELDFSYTYDGVRFRMNLHKQDGTLGLSARLIPVQIPTPDELALEPQIREFANLLDGLVLIVGPTGQGKSTTIASLIQEINRSRKAHIVTIEDPIEFAFQDEHSLIEQREVGVDTLSFATALKHVLRQDPNVIFVGEMRDPETIATVLTAAETGHLVFSTLHTSTAAEAIERIVDVFDGSRQKQVLIQLASVLRGVVAQQLLSKEGGGRVAAREILVNTPAVSSLIRENNIAQIVSAMQTGRKEGMMPMAVALEGLHKKGLISKETMERRTGRYRKI